MRGKTQTNFVQPNCIMQLADSVSVAKIKIIYASRQRAHSEPSALIWRSCAFNRQPMTMPVLDGPMTMPVLDGVKPMAITLPICGTSESLFWKRKKAYIAGLGRDQLEHLASPMTKSESKYQRVQDKSETIEKRLESWLESETGLEYYSPRWWWGGDLCSEGVSPREKFNVESPLPSCHNFLNSWNKNNNF